MAGPHFFIFLEPQFNAFPEFCQCLSHMYCFPKIAWAVSFWKFVLPSNLKVKITTPRHMNAYNTHTITYLLYMRAPPQQTCAGHNRNVNDIRGSNRNSFFYFEGILHESFWCIGSVSKIYLLQIVPTWPTYVKPTSTEREKTKTKNTLFGNVSGLLPIYLPRPCRLPCRYVTGPLLSQALVLLTGNSGSGKGYFTYSKRILSSLKM